MGSLNIIPQSQPHRISIPPYKLPTLLPSQFCPSQFAAHQSTGEAKASNKKSDGTTEHAGKEKKLYHKAKN